MKETVPLGDKPLTSHNQLQRKVLIIRSYAKTPPPPTTVRHNSWSTECYMVIRWANSCKVALYTHQHRRGWLHQMRNPATHFPASAPLSKPTSWHFSALCIFWWCWKGVCFVDLFVPYARHVAKKSKNVLLNRDGYQLHINQRTLNFI